MILDISLPLHQKTITWPNNPPVEIQPLTTTKQGTVLNKLKLGTHSGTHIDAPNHFIPNGNTVDQIPLEKMIGTCQVINIKSSISKITLSDFKTELIKPRSRILFKTNNSKLLESGKFNPNYTSLSLEVATFLADREIWLVGIDYLSIEEYNNHNHPIHKQLLSKEIVILEGLYLDHVPKGQYHLTCLPINFYNTEAAPCRAILTNT